MGFGGPDCLDAVGPFMCNLMGREPSEELVARVRRRYLTIGGSSPLTEIAHTMASRLEEILAEEGTPAPVRVGMRYWDPYISDALRQLAEEGCDRVVALSLSPFESKVAHGAYREAIEEALADLEGMEVVEAPLIGMLDEFPEYFAGATASVLGDLEPDEGAVIAFTAHSLPESDLVDGDPYMKGLRHMASRVAARLCLAPGEEDAGDPMFATFRTFGSARRPRAWYLAYQSKGQKPGAWLGPDIDDLIDAAAEAGVPALVVCPIGFATDHMETLYDLDVVAAGRALDAGLEFARVPVPNDDENLLRAMARSAAALF